MYVQNACTKCMYKMYVQNVCTNCMYKMNEQNEWTKFMYKMHIWTKVDWTATEKRPRMKVENWIGWIDGQRLGELTIECLYASGFTPVSRFAGLCIYIYTCKLDWAVRKACMCGLHPNQFAIVTNGWHSMASGKNYFVIMV